MQVLNYRVPETIPDSMNAEMLSDDIEVSHGGEPRLLCRSAGINDSAPWKILHMVELCFDKSHNAVDCPSEG